MVIPSDADSGDSFLEDNLSARSRVLYNQDLLHLILSSFCPMVPASLSLPSLEFFTRSIPLQLPAAPALLSAALTSKFFFSSAVRLLWYESTLTLLLRVIPILAKDEEGYHLTDVVKEEHLRRLDMYAQNIKQLYISSELFPTEIYEIISRLRPTLLSALRMLNLSLSDRSFLQNTGSLLVAKSPSRLFALKVAPMTSTSEVMVANLLENLSPDALQWLNLGGRLTNISLSLLPRFRRLSNLFLELQLTIDVDVLDLCSKVPNLERLSLFCHPDVHFQAASSAVEFVSLRSLSLQTTTHLVTKLLGMFQVVRMPSLSSLTVVFSVSPAPYAEVVQCVKRCIEIGQSSSLGSLAIMGHINTSWLVVKSVHAIDTLTELKIDVLSLVVSDEDVLQYLEQTRSHILKELTIQCPLGGSLEGAMTPLALGIIARNCPNLEALSIAVRLKVDKVSLSLLENEMETLPSYHCPAKSFVLRLLQRFQGQLHPHKEKYNVVGAAVLSQYIDYCFPELVHFQLSQVKFREDGDIQAEEQDWYLGLQKMTMVKRPKSPDVVEEGRYFTVYQPYPLNVNMLIEEDQIRCAQWIAECIGPQHLLVIYHKPTARGMILLEISKTFARDERLLGEHRWRDMLKDPSNEEKSRVSQVFYCFYNTSRAAQKDGWKAIHVKNSWFKDWKPGRGDIRAPYPTTLWCSVPVEDKTNKFLCRPIPREHKAPPPRPQLPVVGSEEWVEIHVAGASSNPWADPIPNSEEDRNPPSLSVVTGNLEEAPYNVTFPRHSPSLDSASGNDSSAPPSATVAAPKAKVAWGKPVPLKQFNAAKQKSGKSPWATMAPAAPPGAKSPLLEDESDGPVNAWAKPLKIPASERSTSKSAVSLSDSPWSAVDLASPWDSPSTYKSVPATAAPELGSEREDNIVVSSNASSSDKAPWGSKANKKQDRIQSQLSSASQSSTKGKAVQQPPSRENKKWADEVEDEYYQTVPDLPTTPAPLFDPNEDSEGEENLEDIANEVLDPWEAAASASTLSSRPHASGSGSHFDRSGNPVVRDDWATVSVDPDEDMQPEENLWIEELPNDKPPELICPTHKTSLCKKGICRDMARLVREQERKQQMDDKKKNGGRSGRGGRGRGKWRDRGGRPGNVNGSQAGESNYED
ncbi:hypothetical protein CVT26_016222 [Gymnopilus dilepis]|uniref:Uncharacterized protein n=1 Tax=Gymnopilus dilepis TaxID=231916 RepID=A0A409WAC0_9AGAR|nr:hypothetical protein CVT26_016222 [Gymnopilus dilepis]